MPLTAHQLMKLFARDALLMFGSAPEFLGRMTSGSFLTLSGEPYVDLNVGGIFDGPRAGEELADLSAVVAARGLPAIILIAGAVADELAPIALGLGLRPEGTMPLMACEPAESARVRSDLTIERVATAEDLAGANRVTVEAFDIPLHAISSTLNEEFLAAFGVEAYVARRGDEIVSSVWTVTNGEAVGIWTMGTSPTCQRQGAGRALLAQVIAWHTGRGAEQFYLGATTQGLPLYERLGFTTVERAAIWVAGNAPTAHVE